MIVQYILLNPHKNSAEEHCVWLCDTVWLHTTIVFGYVALFGYTEPSAEKERQKTGN
jgi:hypothetical protein